MKNVTEIWDEKAAEWNAYVGERGDNNRRFQSDPVLWNFLGEVTGQKVLDAGCGTGYLSVQLARRGADVVGVDISPKMIEFAKSLAHDAIAKEAGHSYGRKLQVDFKVESVESLASIAENSFDAIVSNYVLMDTPNLEDTVKAFHRVLKKGGRAVVVFSHPCFNELFEDEMYFDEIEKSESWGPFKSEFVFYHRPLKQYWRAFQDAGFAIEDLEEPVADPSMDGFKAEWLAKYKKRPFSIAFKLRKAGGLQFID